MKKIAILSLSALFLTACGGSNQGTVNSNAVPPPPVPQSSSNNPLVSSHSNRNTPDSSMSAETADKNSNGKKSKWTQSGNPIDTSKFDAEIAAAEKELKAKPKDDGAKRALATAYVNRGLALTDARQYASALGDYRRAQKLDPTNEDAKKWIEQIVGIYESINREYPKEGEEPPPLPFNK